MIPLLIMVASTLAGQPVAVTCGTQPLAYHWQLPGPEGAALPDPPRSRIWLEHCDLVLRRDPLAVTCFAHEILHILHPWWRERRVHRWDDWYGRNVVKPWLNRLEAIS